MLVVLDTNVPLDSLFRRIPWNADADAILRLGASVPLDLAVSTLSVSNLFYIGRRIVGTDRARECVRQCLADFVVRPVNRRTLAKADEMPGVDFEDNIQMSVAALAVADVIVTRDPQGFVTSAVAVCSPHEFLQKHAQGPP